MRNAGPYFLACQPVSGNFGGPQADGNFGFGVILRRRRGNFCEYLGCFSQILESQHYKMELESVTPGRISIDPVLPLRGTSCIHEIAHLVF